MKRFLIGLALVSVCVVSLADRVPTGASGRAFVEPYTKVIVLTATTGTWTAASDSIQVYEIRVKSAGTINLIAKGQTTSKDVYLTDFDILRVDVTSIDLDSSTTDTIMVFGYNLK